MSDRCRLMPLFMSIRLPGFLSVVGIASLRTPPHSSPHVQSPSNLLQNATMSCMLDLLRSLDALPSVRESSGKRLSDCTPQLIFMLSSRTSVIFPSPDPMAQCNVKSTHSICQCNKTSCTQQTLDVRELIMTLWTETRCPASYFMLRNVVFFSSMWTAQLTHAPMKTTKSTSRRNKARNILRRFDFHVRFVLLRAKANFDFIAESLRHVQPLTRLIRLLKSNGMS